jgi:hypothetical protein
MKPLSPDEYGRCTSVEFAACENPSGKLDDRDPIAIVNSLAFADNTSSGAAPRRATMTLTSKLSENWTI